MWKRMKGKKVRSTVVIVALKYSDKRHERTDVINAKLEELTKEIEKFDYVYVWAEMLNKEEENAIKKAIWRLHQGGLTQCAHSAHPKGRGCGRGRSGCGFSWKVF
ncbi:hypothetical protein BC332_10183 [Capsicum chinense]|nr:hypothetical protein BC332_10183 [Capsicum chinense]